MDQEKTYKWIQDRIRDLHAGTLSAEDRLRMEELAKTDPFVQDAMEGYQANPDHDHSVLLKVIADRIQHKNASRRPKILPLSKGWVIPAVAASLVLILATWAVMFYIEKQGDAVFVAAEPKASTSIEHSTEVNLSEADSLSENTSSSVAGNDNGPTELKADAQPESKPSIARKESAQKSKGEKEILDTPSDDSKKSEGTITYKAAKESEDELLKEPVVTSTAPSLSQPPGRAAVEMSADKSMAAGAPASKINAKKDEGYYANQISPDLMAMRVSGKVIDEMTGEPVIYAFISVANSTLYSYTDLDGRFDFSIPEPTAEIVVEYTGYFSTSSIVQQGQIDKVIVLYEGSTIPDPRSVIELNRIGLESKHAHFLKVDTEDFRQYLNTNSIYPLATTYDPFGKVVKLEFVINKGQKIDHIKVLKSSGGKQYEEEAIRLLKSGPAWRCEDDRNFPCTREFTIYFK